ncbi:non-ribosomal peptide synthetase [Hymenobacter actinosclerus]|uniref:AMP-binding enzyme C-terminal domain-containing protein n=1 Tax=Hymenobacter actinosclerus TaxID=82805 RepID=A0A1I0IHZ6_9BACT|nr:non-ribosomal peptide synthetase [Hymenobacter actinosclerus]SET96720.1 AMP-binding enzyme C-terminal domain-containing protein [Hymenobacter actinosclerus]
MNNKDNIQQIYPLTPMQEGMLFHTLRDESRAYFSQTTYTAHGELDVDVLARSLAELGRRHDILRTSFVYDKVEQPLQVVLRNRCIGLSIEDLTELSAAEAQARVVTCRQQAVAQGFDLTRDPLIRLAVLRTAATVHEFVWSYHHILMDGWCLSVLLTELREIYRATQAGLPVPLPPPVPFGRYVKWLAQQDKAAAATYWQNYLRGYETLAALPPDQEPQPGAPLVAPEVATLHLSATDTARLTAWARQQQTTLNTVFQALWGILLARYNNTTDVVYGNVVSGRPTDLPDADQIIGLFINTVPLRVSYTGHTRFDELVRQLHQDAVEAVPHHHQPLVEIQSATELRSQLIQHVIAFENYPVQDDLLEGDSVGNDPFSLDNVGGYEHTHYHLDVDVEIGQELAVTISFNPQHYSATYVHRLTGHLGRLFAQVLAEPTALVAELELLTPAERAEQLHMLNRGAIELGNDLPINLCFEQQVACFPEALAVVHNDVTWTYAQLNTEANRIGHQLQKLGVGAEDFVGVNVERGPGLVAAMLGILKLGARYVPLDVQNPASRNCELMASSTMQGLISDAAGLAILLGTEVASWPLVLSLDPLPANTARQITNLGIGWADADTAPDQGAAENLPNRNRMDSWAYMLYTSGSTGQPKGAITRHDGAMNHILAEINELDLPQGFRFLQSASISSDISVWQILGPLMHGGTTVIIDKDDLLNYEALLRVLVRHDVTIIEFVPSFLLGLTDYIDNYYSETNPLPSLRWLMMVGEVVSVDLVNQWLRVVPGCRIVNGYGPCEASDDIAQYLIEQPLGPEVRKVAIGRPIANMNIFVVDRFGRLLPRGIVGELAVSGVGVGAGYWQEPAKTAISFVPNHFEGTLGDTIYRTGDLTRWLPDGNLEFLGRVDHQVKIRGYRVELGEIESRLHTCPAVEAAAVVIRPYQGEQQIIAYLVPRQSKALTDADLQQQVRRQVQEFVKAQLATYMHPAEYVLLAAFPLNLSDKVDRKALPEPGGTLRKTVLVPVNDTEIRLLELWQKILTREVIGTDENFFDVGGHSLKATRLAAHINKAFDTNISVRTIFTAPTIQQLARAVQGNEAAYQSITLAPAQADYPLSHAQRRLWLVNQLNPEEQFSYNMTVAYRLTGPLQPEALAKALQQLVTRHEILRTVFVTEAGEPRQRVGTANASHTLRYNDWRGQPEAEAAAMVQAQEDFHTVFNLAEGPLFQARLMQLADEDFVFVLVLHHIVADGWSSDILLSDLLTLYQAARTETVAVLPTLPIQYKDFAVWHNAQLASPAAEAHRAYWRAQFAGEVPVLEMPTDFPRPAHRTQRGAVLELRIDAATTSGLRQLSSRRGATLFMGLVASVKALLYRYTGQTDLVVGTVASGREHSDLEHQIGFYVNTLPLRTRLAGTASFEVLLDQVKQVALGAFEHQSYPFDQLVDDLQVPRELSRSPLFDVLVVLQSNSAEAEAANPASELTFNAVELSQGYSKFDLTVEAWEEAEGLTVALEYSTDLFMPARIERMAGHYAQLLRAIVAGAHIALDALDYLPTTEQTELLGFAGTSVPVLPEQTVSAQFEQMAARYPNQVAVADNERTLTYAQLNAEANQLARYLREQYEVGAESIVAVALTRRVEFVTVALAVLKAGGAYLPLEVNLPAERVAELLTDTNARVLLTDAEALPRALGGAYACLHPGLVDCSAFAATNLAHGGPQSNSLAYVMYTSGSTGKPKGVMVEHRGIIRLVLDADYIHFGPGQRMLQTGSLAFDAATFEIWGPLLHGGQVHILALDHLLDTDKLRHTIQQKAITDVFFTTSWFNQLADEAPDLFHGLRRVLTGGEKISVAHVRRVQEHCPNVELVNLYGPTENTTLSTYYRIPRPAPATIPLGGPIANSTVYVVDGQGRLVPKGIPGELWLGGEGLARGYWQDADRTRQQFVPNPFGQGLLYCSGDRACWREDGQLDFLGRVDNQVKIRGFRIEPDEIASLLKTHPGVAEAFVLVQADAATDKLLVAYYTLSEPLLAESLRKFLQNQLPAYMVPSLLVPLATVPLHPNGKLNRYALPEIGPLLAQQSAANSQPDTPTEAALLAIWADVLGRESISVEDDFFSIGGNSLKAVRVLASVQQQFDRKIGLAIFFQHPSVRTLACVIESRSAERPTTIPTVTPAPRYDVSRAQRRIWVMDQLETDRAAYNITGTYALPSDLDAVTLAQAVRRLADRHEILRTTFVAEDGQPYQHVLPGPQPALALVIRTVATADFEATVARAAQAEQQHVFDLEALPLLRLHLLTDAASRHVLIVNLHHIIGDGWSLLLLLSELSAHYHAIRTAELPLPELPMQYKDYAAWHNQQLQEAPSRHSEQYWLDQLSGLDARPDLPLDHDRAAVRSYASAVLPFELNAPLADALRSLCEQQGASLFMGLQAVVKVWLARLLPTEMVTVGTTAAGREQPGLAKQLGCYVNVLPLRTQLYGLNSFDEVLAAVRKTTLAAFEHQSYPFDLLVEKLGLRRDLSRNLLFDVMLNFLDGLDLADDEAPGTLRFADWQSDAQDATNKYDLTLCFQSLPNGAIAGELIYNTSLFLPSRAAGFRDQLLALSAELLADPTAPLRLQPVARPTLAPISVSLEDDFA